MKKQFLAYVLFFSAILGLTSCSIFSTGNQKETKGGLKYTIYSSGDSDRETVLGDVIYGTMGVFIGDSILFETDEIMPIMRIEEPIFMGDLNEGLILLKAGDSAVFIVNADSIRKSSGGALPEIVKEEISYWIKVDRILSEAELMQDQADMAITKAAEEKEAIAKYLHDNELKIEPTESGLYYIELNKGAGSIIKQGQTVKVDYVGRLLDGKIFDTSKEEAAAEAGLFMPGRTYEPMEVPAGVGQLIAGMDEALLKMRVGGKALIIVPFSLAYGPQRVSDQIVEFSTLVFEIEIVGVK